MSINRVILMGGLGNQLFQCAFANHLSIETNSDVMLDPNFLTIRLGDSGEPELSQFLLGKRISIAPKNTESQLIRRALGLTLRLQLTNQGFFNKIGFLVTRFITTMLISARFRAVVHLHVASDNGFEEFRLRSKNSLYVGYFQSYLYPEAIKGQTPKEIFPVKMESPSASKFLNLSREEKPLLVHIRLTDYRNESKFGIPTKAYYKKAIEYHFRKFPYGAIWTFSDEPEMAASFIPDQYKGLIRNVSEEISNTVETLEIMRLARGYVLANSSYSWWAAFSSHADAPLVTYPSPWFAQIPEPNRLFPPNWRAIER